MSAPGAVRAKAPRLRLRGPGVELLRAAPCLSVLLLPAPTPWQEQHGFSTRFASCWSKQKCFCRLESKSEVQRVNGNSVNI